MAGAVRTAAGIVASCGEIVEVVGVVVASRMVWVLGAVIRIAATEDEERRLERECQAVVGLGMVVVIGEEVWVAEPEAERVCPWWLIEELKAVDPMQMFAHHLYGRQHIRKNMVAQREQQRDPMSTHTGNDRWGDLLA